MTTDSAVYAFGGLVGQLAALVTFPLYTRVLGVEAYGVFALLMAFVSVGRSVLVFGMNTALIRFYVHGTDEERRHVVGSCAAFTIAVALVAVGAGLVWPAQILSLITDSTAVDPIAVSITMAVLGSDVVVEMLLALARARQAPRTYVNANITRVVVTLAAVSAMLFAGAGVPGAFAGLLTGNVAAAVVLVVSLRSSLSASFDRRLVTEMIRFGSGLVPANLAQWALDVADRYVIERFLGLAAVGLYSAGYRVGSLVTVSLVLPFHTAFLPSMLGAVKEGCGDEFIERTARYYTAVVGIAVMVLSGIGAELLRLFAGPGYMEGAVVVGPVALGCALAGSVSVFGPGILVKGKTHLSAAVFLVAAGVNVLGNVVVVPRWGLLGAAIVTTVTYLLLAVAYVRASQHVFPVGLDVRRMFVGLAVVTAVVTAGVLAYEASLSYPVALGVRVGSALAGTAALVLFGVVTTTELRVVVGELRGAFARKLARR